MTRQYTIAVIPLAPVVGETVRVGAVTPLRHRVSEGFGCEGAQSVTKDVPPNGLLLVLLTHLDPLPPGYD